MWSREAEIVVVLLLHYKKKKRVHNGINWHPFWKEHGIRLWLLLHPESISSSFISLLFSFNSLPKDQIKLFQILSPIPHAINQIKTSIIQYRCCKQTIKPLLYAKHYSSCVSSEITDSIFSFIRSFSSYILQSFGLRFFIRKIFIKSFPIFVSDKYCNILWLMYVLRRIGLLMLAVIWYNSVCYKDMT